MRLAQRYFDHSTELTSILFYLQSEAGGPNDNATRLGVSADEVLNILALRATFEAALNAYSDADKHNAITVQLMKDADYAAFAVILPLRQRLKNGVAALTAEDYAHLGIHRDKTTRTPAEIPTDVPTATWVKSDRLGLTYEATQQSPEGTNRLALPKDVRVARLLAVMPQGVEPTDGDYHPLETVTRSRFKLGFVIAEIGMNAYIRIAYENTAGRGPFSLPVKAIII